MTSDAIVTENLTKVYGKLTAVDHVNVKVASGTVFGLLGPNGAGKTTMIKLLTGLTDMTEGEAWVAGFDVRRDPMHVKQRIGWVASEVILDDDFMDEPTVGLDANTRRMLWDLITGVNKEFGITVLLTSHYIEEADALCQQISIIDHGKIVASGSPSALKARVESDFVELETGEAVDEAKLRSIPGVTEVRSQGKTWILQVSAAEEVLPHMFSTLKTEAIRRINVEKPSLETVFLDITGKRIDQAGADVPDYRKFYATMRRARQ